MRKKIDALVSNPALLLMALLVLFTLSGALLALLLAHKPL